MRVLYADIVVNITSGHFDRCFTYRVPEELQQDALVGSRVSVPLGRGNRMAEGYIVSLSDSCDLPDDKCKDIAAVLTDALTVESHLVMLASKMAAYYSCPLASALKTVLPAAKKVNKRASRVQQLPFAKEERDLPLSPAQCEAIDQIHDAFGKKRPVLLYGATGSGKTRIYMEEIEAVLEEGKQAIVLIPEIALTYQTVGRFRRRFGGKVSFLHSRLSQGERFELLKDARSGKVSVVVGPRSALFAPFASLGLIVIDEEHDEAYRSESTPRYDARVVAKWRCEAEGAHLLLGSATPSLRAMQQVEDGMLVRVDLAGHFGSGRGDALVVDMKEELAAGNRSIISHALRQRLEQSLRNGHQAMLFLNRRGYAGFVSCRSCGEVMQCPHCAVSLTEHADGRLRCHYCGYERPKPDKCPSCGSAAFGGMKVGTQQVVTQVKKLFPEARVLRMDKDTTGGKAGHETILSAFAKQKADILVGTQMIVKGHDYPSVDTVGVLMADLSLHESDYRCAERTYQLVTQAIGRAGRGDAPGTAIIQTYQPEHTAILAAALGDADRFYREEMAFRQMMSYPPKVDVMAVLGSGKEEAVLRSGMLHITELLRKIDRKNTLRTLGPCELPVRKVKDTYRLALYLRGEHEKLAMAAERIFAYVRANRGFAGLTIQVDYNV